MKPIPAPVTFTNVSPPWNLTFLDANDNAAANAINDINTYSNCFQDQSGTPNQITVVLPTGLTFELQFGVAIQVKVENTNTSATVELTVGSTSAPVVGVGGAALNVGLLVAGGIYSFQFDGANWQIFQVTLTQQQIGGLLYPQTPAEAALSVTPTNINFPPGNVLRYGADPTGVNDSYPAIQNAINVINNWTTYSSSLGNKQSPGTDANKGGEVFIPAGTYLISTTVLLATGIKLRGACPVRETATEYGGPGVPVTTLKASPSFPGGQYLVDNGIYRLKNESNGSGITPYRVVQATDIFIRGNDTDNLYCNFMQNMTVQDMQLDGNSVAAGGLRCQGAAFFYVDGVTVVNTQYTGYYFAACFEFGIGKVTAIAPAPLVIMACESAMQDGAEMQLYSVASAAWVNTNQANINAILYPFNDPVGSWYNLTLKVINIQWSINVTLGYISANSGNVGIELYHSNCNILHWENEFSSGGALFLLRVAKCRCDGLTTKSVMPLSTGDSVSKLVIREPGAIQSTTSFTPLNGESSSTFEVQLYNVIQSDPILGITTHFSVVNVTKIFPDEGISPQGFTLFVRPSGSPTNDGLLSGAPCTIDAALTFIENNRHIKEWNISFTNGDTNNIGAAHFLRDVRITWGTLTGSAILSTSVNLLCEGVKFFFGFCQINGWNTSSSMFVLEGVNEIEFGPSCVITIPANLTLFQPSTSNNRTARIQTGGFFPTINFGSGSGMCNGNNSLINYEDTFISPTLTGTPALEAVSTGRVKKVLSTVF